MGKKMDTEMRKTIEERVRARLWGDLGLKAGLNVNCAIRTSNIAVSRLDALVYRGLRILWQQENLTPVEEPVREALSGEFESEAK